MRAMPTPEPEPEPVPGRAPAPPPTHNGIVTHTVTILHDSVLPPLRTTLHVLPRSSPISATHTAQPQACSHNPPHAPVTGECLDSLVLDAVTAMVMQQSPDGDGTPCTEWGGREGEDARQAVQATLRQQEGEPLSQQPEISARAALAIELRKLVEQELCGTLREFQQELRRGLLAEGRAAAWREFEVL